METPLGPASIPLRLARAAAIQRALAMALVISPASLAEEAPPALARSLAELSIEQLLNESVTSVSRRETRWMDTPAAITVLTNDDLRRSGATTLADALRLVPGVNVGAVNASQSAISARGFNELYSNKMLVQIDGRAVYNPIFAGVFWDIQQPMLEDVDRIEVIRGPGASVWGANAVNGVISVVSRSARETQGGLFYNAFGNVHETMTGFRYGGKIGDNTYYRVFGNYRVEDDFLLSRGGHANDGWDASHGGFRIDHYSDPDTQLTWQADASGADLHNGSAAGFNFNTILRWTRQLGDHSSVELQAYIDRVRREDILRADGAVNTTDLSAQHSFRLGDSHQFLWGVGYRFVNNELKATNPALLVYDEHFHLHLFSAFVQDEWELVPERFKLIPGLKIEHNDYTGFELQPSLRTLYTPSPDHTLWSAISRAVRTPSAIEADSVLGFVAGAPFPGPGGVYLPVISGSEDPDAEVLWAYEVGYRMRPASWATVDVAAFYNRYSGLIHTGGISGLTPGVPFGSAKIPLTNQLRGHTFGGEVAVTVRPSDSWRLIGSYAFLQGDFKGAPAATAPLEGSLPAHQVVLRSSHELTANTSFDVQLRYVDQTDAVPDYLTADARLAYRLAEGLEIALVGQNLLADSYREQDAQFLAPGSEVPRSYYLRVTCEF